MSVVVDKKDEIIMQLVHYFVTEENYEPILVNGVKNEIWLENLQAPYKVIRINSNYIHNDEQLKFDIFKIKSITKQIKKKTFSFKIKTLNILLDLNDDVKIDNDKNIDIFKVNNLKDLRKDNNLGGLYPKLKTRTLTKEDNIDMIVNITNDINKKTEKNNIEFEKIFKPKKIIITNLIIALNIIIFFLANFYPGFLESTILNRDLVRSGEVYRLFTSMFLHTSVVHLLFNMYALASLGKQVETYIGKWKFLLVYLLSGLAGSLLFCTTSNNFGLGASGAIFGLLGCLLYFGYHYRLYLGSVLLSQIIPIILINLFIGFSASNISNSAHIGGLVGGLFVSMAVGLTTKEDKQSRINGIITSIILFAFLIYLTFFR